MIRTLMLVLGSSLFGTWYLHLLRGFCIGRYQNLMALERLADMNRWTYALRLLIGHGLHSKKKPLMRHELD